MTRLQTLFADQGFAIVPGVIAETEVAALSTLCEAEANGSAGRRDLLKHGWVRQLASRISNHPQIVPLLPAQSVACQCTLFCKSAETNWNLRMHRDTSIPVRRPFDAPEWRNWTKKDGVHFVQPPQILLQSMVAVRLHLETNSAINGALKVVPGSHRDQSINGAPYVCESSKGSVLVMRPLLLHGSSKVQTGVRRVLHFLFGPATLPPPARWITTW